MSTKIEILVTRPDAVPMLRVSGDLGALLEIRPTPGALTEFSVAASDGTLLVGSIGSGFRVEAAGSEARADGMIATIEGPVTWISTGAQWITKEQSDEYRADSLEGSIDHDEPESPFDGEGEIEDISSMPRDEMLALLASRYGAGN